MHDQIRILKKDLKEANEQIATHTAAAPTTAAMAAIPALTATAAAAAQAPPTTPARHIYHGHGEEMNFHRPPRRQLDRRPPRCFLCGEKATLCLTVLHTSSFNASSASRRVPAPVLRLEDI